MDFESFQLLCSVKPVLYFYRVAGVATSTSKDFMAEFQTMAKIKKHPNVVCLLGACLHEGE